MTWARLDDGFADHPKVVGLSDRAFRLHILAICYAARHKTDGMVPFSAPFIQAWRKAAQELCDSGLWDREQTGFGIHDYLDYNPSRDELENKRMAKAMAGAKGAASRWNGTSYATGNAPDPSPSRPPLPPAAAAAPAKGYDDLLPDDPHRRAYRAWNNQSPGGLNPTVRERIDAELGDGILPEWIELACESAAESGGNKPWKYVRAKLDRYKRQGGTNDQRPVRAGEAGGTTAFVSAFARDLEEK